jgi:hypothetical protein
MADVAAALAMARQHPELFPVGGIFAIDDWRQAIDLVESPGITGFVFLKP